MIPGLSTIYVYLILGGIVLASAGGLYWYVTSLQDDLETEKTNNILLKNAIEEQSKVVTQMQTDITHQKEISNDIVKTTEVQSNELSDLKSKLTETKTGARRDIGVLAKKRSATMERLFNNGTKNVVRCLELASGAEVKPDEHNKECPRLLGN